MNYGTLGFPFWATGGGGGGTVNLAATRDEGRGIYIIQHLARRREVTMYYTAMSCLAHFFPAQVFMMVP